MKYKTFLVIGALALLVAAVSGCTNETPTGTQTGSPTPTAFGIPVTYTASNGETNYTVTVYSAEKVDSYVWHGASGTAYTETAQPGKTYIMVDSAFRNAGLNKVYVLSSDFSIQDSTGFKYDNTYTSVDNSLSSTSLMTGQQVRGIVSFEVPQNATGLQLIFDPNYLSTGMSTATIWDIT